MKKIKVLIVDDHTLVRDGIRALLALAADIDVVGEAAEAQSFLSQAQALKPDLILLDWELPGQPAGSLMASLSALDLDARVVVLSGRPEARKAALAAGADAFLSKADAPEQVLTTLHQLATK